MKKVGINSRLIELWISSKWLITLIITGIVSAYLGYAVPRWMADQKIIELERGYSNKTLPQNLRFSAPGTKHPFFFATDPRLENVGDVDLLNKDINVILATSSMDCGVIKEEDHRAKVFQTGPRGLFDADFDNFIYLKNNGMASIHVSKLKRGERREFLIFSNFAFRPALIPLDSALSVRSKAPKRPDKSFEDDPWKLTNCKHLTDAVAAGEARLEK